MDRKKYEKRMKILNSHKGRRDDRSKEVHPFTFFGVLAVLFAAIRVTRRLAK